ncbi:MAG: hypothetical protein IIX15_04070 [Clostridia bacterium]|nr:hypothetical protein [Clostridia bacterium]
MPQIFMSEKEAAAVAVIVESYLLSYPQSCTAEMVKKIPERISKCIEMQGKKKAATNKGNGKNQG